MINFYAGIGSRNTPENILNIMKFIAIKLDSDGFCLRSGHAIGADTAFESNIKNKEIFEANDASLKAIEYASNFHNNWNNCSNYVKKLHGRNAMIILGKNEVENNSISVRKRDGEKMDNISLDEFLNNLKEEIKEAFNK